MYVLQFCHVCNEVICHPNDYTNHYPSDPFICLGKISHELSNEGFGTHLPFKELAAAVKFEQMCECNFYCFPRVYRLKGVQAMS